MKKIILEIEPEQLTALTGILVSASMGYYESLPQFKNEAGRILDCLKQGKIVDREEAIFSEDIDSQDKEEFVEEIQVDTSYLPKEWFDTYNVQFENNSELDLVTDEENLRFIFGKQGQIGIQYWHVYEETSDPDTVIFIKNSDAIRILQRLGDRTNDFNLLPERGSIDLIEKIDDKYEIAIRKRGSSCITRLFKKKEDGSNDYVKFYNEKQLRIFYEFLKYHLDK